MSLHELSHCERCTTAKVGYQLHLHSQNIGWGRDCYTLGNFIVALSVALLAVVITGPESGSGALEDDLDEAEVLRDIWSKQGVGQDGYLSYSELGAICENMGMEKMSDKVFTAVLDKVLCVRTNSTLTIH